MSFQLLHFLSHQYFISSYNSSLVVDEEMRDRMERLVVLPFSVGCISESSVAVAVQRPRRSKSDATPSAISISLSLSHARVHTHTHIHTYRYKHSYSFLIPMAYLICVYFFEGSKEEDDLESLSGDSMKSSFRFLVSPKPNITTGFHKLFKGFKNFSQLFGMSWLN